MVLKRMSAHGFATFVHHSKITVRNRTQIMAFVLDFYSNIRFRVLTRFMKCNCFKLYNRNPFDDGQPNNRVPAAYMNN